MIYINVIKKRLDGSLGFLSDVEFNVSDFYSDKFYLEIQTSGVLAFPVQINSINIY